MPSLTEAALVLILLYLAYKVLDWLLRLPKLRLSSKTRNILVTGCDSGFGRLFAKRMDSKGFRVFAGCFTTDGVNQLKDECSSMIKPFLLDVTSEESVQKAVLFVKSNLGDGEGLWALFNNAGVGGPWGITSWLNKKDFEVTLAANFLGVQAMCSAFLPLIKHSRGRIINTASILGRLSVPTCAPYVVSKFAVRAYSDALRRDICHFGVSVHIIEPGFFNTGFFSRKNCIEGLEKKWATLDDDMQQDYGENYIEAATDVYEWSRSLLTSQDLSLVLDAYEHAALARYPRTNYVVGWIAKLFIAPLSMLPSCISDRVLYYETARPSPRKEHS